jgi:deoxyribodipyrimidine photo-lyase
VLNEAGERAGGGYVLYWMQMNRRAQANHALEFAAAEANRLNLPLLVYEAITCDYPHANDRLHTFLLEGVPNTARELKKRGIGYAFHLRKKAADPNGTFYRAAAGAALVVTDDYPTFIARRHNRSVPPKLDAPYYAVDSSCVVPMRCIEKKQYAAYTIRPRIKKLLREHLRPVDRVPMKRKWREAPPEWHTEVEPGNIARLVGECEIDHTVPPSISFHGGSDEAARHLRHFLRQKLRRYNEERNEPSAHATSDLSPWLHFGHISAMEVALAAQLEAAENGVDASGFLEELIVRRELAFNHAWYAKDPKSLDNLPDWARTTLDDHRKDKREATYSLEEFEQARTHDDLWNATQKEMLLRGKIHGYYRMYWGKKIIEWSRTPEDALATMIHIHDRWALDGRDPNTYTNILWCFGLHDRPWSERPVFGKVRYMSLGGMRRKTGVDAYLQEIQQMESTGSDPFALK